MRASRSAAVGVVSESVNMETSLGVGVVAGDIPGDLGGRRLGVLLEDDSSGDLAVTTDHADYSSGGIQLADD